MSQTAPQQIYLRDYQPPAYLVDDVHLTFKLSPNATRVISKVRFRPNPAATQTTFFLHGEDLRLITAAIDGTAITPDVTPQGLTCDVPNAPFTWEAEVEIDPAGNTALEGLYMSGGIYCTQCEAEGFRKITYYPDRPDVLATFTVRVEGDLPVLLSNGNPTTSGAGFAQWHDPWPKPAYLFALVAGDLAVTSDSFTTLSGTDVALNIYVRPDDADKCDFAMSALKASMTWDEEVYDREYDLAVFNIVAVDDFNAGAMENKGLNVFNSALVLASPQTATDGDYERIEAVIAHEYFHNWTGNRITCRDWFQLCLKEGLTVYRDQQFTGDMRGHAIKRIDDAQVLRAHQFREDSGPLAHPVRPASFVEINNFYTATVYEKGAEVIGMLRRIVGDDAYARACALYFERHDGEAVTIEDWLHVFEDTTGRDLAQFKRWYTQAGTPHLHATTAQTGDQFTLTLRQDLPASADGSPKEPQVIPVGFGLIGADGAQLLDTQTLILDQSEQTYSFDGIAADATPSILRGFSAPVVLHHAKTTADLAHLLAHDSDPFNRWDAGRVLAQQVILDLMDDDLASLPAYLTGVQAVFADRSLDPAFRAKVLGRPSENDTATAISAAGGTPDPVAIHAVHDTLTLHIAQHLQHDLPRVYAEMTVTEPFAPDAAQAGKRSLGNRALSLLSQLDGGTAAAAQFASADNMTQQIAALAALAKIDKAQDALAAFEAQWQHERLVMNKWFRLQVNAAPAGRTVQVARDLTTHAAFEWKNPNRFRAVFGALIGNTAGFHAADGSGYALLADWLIKLDAANPQTAARLTTAFDTWRRYGPERQEQMKSALQRIANTDNLSPDVTEIAGRILS